MTHKTKYVSTTYTLQGRQNMETHSEIFEGKNITDMVTLSWKEYENLRYRGNVINQHVTPNMTELHRRMKIGCL